MLRDLGLKTLNAAVVWSGSSRPDTLQAALLVKLRYIQGWTEQRRANARRYRERLADLPQVQTPGEGPHERAVYQVSKILADVRDALQAYLAGHGIGSAVHYAVPLHLQALAAELDYVPGSFTATEAQAERILSIPVYHSLTPAEIEYVAATIHAFYAGRRD